ncbi:MAG TPA: PLD nuclease N-terminal domain-containing protein [Gemmatimonadaceae bacterium]|nr:PLD nuclease N-terminal domain-containing protein [Gemmatimonadaceae bacterium]
MTLLSTQLSELSTPVLIALIALGTVQLTLQVIALIDLSKRPAVAGGRKWVWIIVIVLGGLIGAFAYLAAGRAQVSGAGESLAGNDEARRRAIDKLYGPDKRP